MQRFGLVALLAAAVCSVPVASQPRITVHADIAIAKNLSTALIGAGIEDVNHELVGGIYTQLVWGESFEEPAGPDGISGSGSATRITWIKAAGPSQCTFEVDTGDAFNGAQSQAITAPAGVSSCAIVNRGLDAGGLYLSSSMTYSGHLFAKVLSTAAVTVTASLVDTTGAGTTLASGQFQVQPGADWSQFNFTLTPSASTSCAQNNNPAVPCASNAEGLCISCTGALTISVAGPGTVLLDQVYLTPTGPGVLAGQPTRADVVSLIAPSGWPANGSPGMSLTAMRLGGSAILVDGYKWKRFRGPAQARQPYDGWWYPYSSSGWGLFEFLPMCEATPGLDTCVVTLNSGETPEDISDLLEYSYGDAEGTVWGMQRAQDGRVQPYRPYWIEIGNEQNHTDPAYIAQVVGLVQALNSSAARLALPFRLQVVIGAVWITWPPQQAVPMATALAPYTPYMDLHWDFHIGGDNPSSDPITAWTFLASVRDVFNTVAQQAGTPPMLGAVLEENGSRHDMQRALGHARMNNRLQCLAGFVRVDTAANGLQVAGRNDNSWDQGQLFVTQDTAYLSPAGMAQVVLSASAADAAVSGGQLTSLLAVEAAGLASSPQLDVIALGDSTGSHVVVRAVNIGSTATEGTVVLEGCSLTNSTAIARVLSGNLTAQNLPTAPTQVMPRVYQVQVTPGTAPSFNFTFPAYSFTAITVACQASSSSGSFTGATTCDLPSGPSVTNLTWAGHVWSTYNDGPWSVSNGPSPVLSLPCASMNCYDEAIMADGVLPSGPGSTSFVSVDVDMPASSGQTTQVAGLLVRCIYPGAQPGMDSFNCYEVSLATKGPGGQGSGYVMVGAHYLPGSFSQIQQVSWDVAPGVPHTLAVNMTVASDGSAVSFTISVDGTVPIVVSDSSFVHTINGGHVAVRAFYQDAQWTNLVAQPLSPAEER